MTTLENCVGLTEPRDRERWVTEVIGRELTPTEMSAALNIANALVSHDIAEGTWVPVWSRQLGIPATRARALLTPPVSRRQRRTP